MVILEVIKAIEELTSPPDCCKQKFAAAKLKRCLGSFHFDAILKKNLPSITCEKMLCLQQDTHSSLQGMYSHPSKDKEKEYKVSCL